MNDNKQSADQESYFVIRIRRRPFTSWLMWFLWLLSLAILLEFTITSFSEHEPQAGVVAGALFFGLLLAGVIVEIVRTTENRSQYRDITSGQVTAIDSEINYE